MMNIGKNAFDRPIALAPMEDVTTSAFRLVCKELGADLVYTEFTSSEALIRHVDKARRKIRVLDEERPVGIQIFGSAEDSMARAAQMAENFGPDLIDINCGCWSKTHALRGEGAGMLRDLARFERVVKATVKATRLPVTVKTRLGWDRQSIVILDVARMLEQAGVQALTVHFRTRCQGYKGEADWSWIPKIKKVTALPLIGNGDVTGPEDVKRMFDMGCDGVMIGRAAVQNPWIFRQARDFLATGRVPDGGPSLQERVELCIRHLRLAVSHLGVRDGLIPFRKYYAGYLRGVPHVARLRSDLMQYTEIEPIIDRLNRFLEQVPQAVRQI